MTSLRISKVSATTNSGLVDDHDPNDIGQKKDAQKPQWKQAEGRSQAEKNLKPAKGDTLKDNKPDA
jgi:hypothetical protein